jgi:hypothetical protein
MDANVAIRHRQVDSQRKETADIRQQLEQTHTLLKDLMKVSG